MDFRELLMRWGSSLLPRGGLLYKPITPRMLILYTCLSCIPDKQHTYIQTDIIHRKQQLNQSQCIFIYICVSRQNKSTKKGTQRLQKSKPLCEFTCYFPSSILSCAHTPFISLVKRQTILLLQWSSAFWVRSNQTLARQSNGISAQCNTAHRPIYLHEPPISWPIFNLFLPPQLWPLLFFIQNMVI